MSYHLQTGRVGEVGLRTEPCWGKRRSGAAHIETDRLGLVQHSMDVARKPVQSPERDPRPESLWIRSDCPGRRTVAPPGLGPYSARLGAIPRPPCGADVYCTSLPTGSPDTVVIPASGVFRAMVMELQMKHSSSLVSPHVAASSTLGASATGFNVRSRHEKRHVTPYRHQSAQGELL
jgi:hypothetical protein